MKASLSARNLSILKVRVTDAASRLHEACNATDPVVVNAAVGDWLDSVYAAQEPYWCEARSVVVRSRDHDEPGARVVGGLIHARNRSTHEWAVLGNFENVFDRYWRPHWGAWCWTTSVPSNDGLARFFVDLLGWRLLTDCIEPATEFLTETLPRSCSIARGAVT